MHSTSDLALLLLGDQFRQPADAVLAGLLLKHAHQRFLSELQSCKEGPLDVKERIPPDLERLVWSGVF